MHGCGCGVSDEGTLGRRGQQAAPAPGRQYDVGTTSLSQRCAGELWLQENSSTHLTHISLSHSTHSRAYTHVLLYTVTSAQHTMGRLSFFLLSSLLLIAVVFADTSNSIEERNSPAPGGIATRYWDCCKPSGAWPGKADVNRPVQACAADGFTRLTDPNAKNGCEGGTAFGCNQHKPFRSKHNKKISFAFAAMSQSLGESNFEVSRAKLSCY